MFFKVIFRQSYVFFSFFLFLQCPWFTLIKDKASYLNAKSTQRFKSHRGCLRHDKYYKHEKWSLTFTGITINLLFPLCHIFLFFFLQVLSCDHKGKLPLRFPTRENPFILLIPEVSDHEVWRLKWKSYDLIVSIIIKSVNRVLLSHSTQSRRGKPSSHRTCYKLHSLAEWSLFNTAPRGLPQLENNKHYSCAVSVMEWVKEVHLIWDRSNLVGCTKLDLSN